MQIHRRVAVVGCTVSAVIAALVAPALAKGGGGGGGGNPGSQPYIQFKAGGYSVTEGTTNAVIQVQRVPKGTDQIYFSTNGSPNGAVGAANCSDPATDYIIQTNHLVGIGSNGVGTALVPICDNSFFENTETVNLVLSAAGTTPVGGKITAQLTISDNDRAPVLSVNSRTGAEGTTQTFTVTASSADPLLPLSFHWSTSDGTATVADGDYAAQSGNGSIAPGNTTTTFDITSLNDGVFEPGTDEYLWVNLSSPVNSSISSTAGSGKDNLQDINSPPTLAVNDMSVSEGGVLTFTVTRTGMTTVPATFDWSTAANGTAAAGALGTDCTTAGLDYVSTGATAVSIPSGGLSNTTTFNVTSCEDATPESNETFTVNLTNAGGSTISDATGVGTINDNDNGGFETGDLTGWNTYVDNNSPTPVVTNAQSQGGTFSAFLGGNAGCGCNEPTGNSAVYRDVTIPATGTTTLSFWVLEQGDQVGIDEQFAQVKENSGAFNVLDTIFNDGSADSAGLWVHKTYTFLPAQAGQTVQLIWAVTQDGAGAPTSMYVDDVQISYTP